MQRALARMGTRQAVSNWERGSNLPDIETLIRIATTFDGSLDRLTRTEVQATASLPRS